MYIALIKYHYDANQIVYGPFGTALEARAWALKATNDEKQFVICFMDKPR